MGKERPHQRVQPAERGADWEAMAPKSGLGNPNPDPKPNWRLRGGKGQLYEGGVRMPGAVVWPGVVAAGVPTP